jgi:D-alanyl-D-alanine carboxypeptidase (penicillin-binding protein 5/6)
VNLRGDEAARVMGVAFREFRSYPIFNANAVVGQAQVWGGQSDFVPVIVKTEVAPTMQVDSHSGIRVVMHYDGPLKAPIAPGQQVGTLTVTAPDYPGYTVPVYAQREVPEAGIIGKIFLGIRSLISGKK